MCKENNSSDSNIIIITAAIQFFILAVELVQIEHEPRHSWPLIPNTAQQSFLDHLPVTSITKAPVH